MKPGKEASELLHTLAIEPDTRGYRSCSHSATHIEFCAPGFVHYARVICDRCGRFVDWLPRPSTLMRRKMMAYRLGLLARAARLSPWERGFVESVSEKRKLSPRQQAKCDELWSTHTRRSFNNELAGKHHCSVRRG